MKRRRRITLQRLAPLHRAFFPPSLSHQLPIAASLSPPHSTPTSGFLQRRHGPHNPHSLLCRRLCLPSCARCCGCAAGSGAPLRPPEADGTSNACPRRRTTTRNQRRMVPIVPNVQVSIDLGFGPSTVPIDLGFITGTMDMRDIISNLD